MAATSSTGPLIVIAICLFFGGMIMGWLLRQCYSDALRGTQSTAGASYSRASTDNGEPTRGTHSTADGAEAPVTTMPEASTSSLRYRGSGGSSDHIDTGAEPTPTTTSVAVQADALPYWHFTVDGLREELRRRGMRAVGRREELLSALLAAISQTTTSSSTSESRL